MKRIAVVTLIIIVDQLSKFFVVKSLLPSLGGFFDSVVCNPNIAWGIPIQGTVLVLVWLVFALAFVILLEKTNWNMFLLAAFGGALSNIIDRIRLGCVLDFINFSPFPTFNIPDICITAGIVLFLLTRIRNNESEISEKE